MPVCFLNNQLRYAGLITAHWEAANLRSTNLFRYMTSRVAKLLHPAWRIVLSVILCSLTNITTAEIKTSILVPDASGAAKIIYDEVINSVGSHSELDISIIRLNAKTTAADISDQVKSNGSELVISIGNKGYKLVKAQNLDLVVVAGGISGKPNGIPTLSLTGDPEPTLRELKTLAPHIKNLRLVYHEETNGWWYHRAKTIGQQFGIEVIGYEAKDLKTGVKLYEQLLKEAKPKETAVWIPLRSIVPSKTILPLLLEQAWKKKLSVISNNPSHTKLGSLIALYPDHGKMGSQLAEFALAHYYDNDARKIVGTTSLRIALNSRTSSHIGLRLSTKDFERFDKIFPLQR